MFGGPCSASFVIKAMEVIKISILLLSGFCAF